MQGELVTIAALSAQLGMDRSNTRKYANRNGVTWVRTRTPESRGQATLALSPDDAERLYALRTAEGFTLYPSTGASTAPVILSTDIGVFYLIQLIPDIAPNRIKVGFTRNMAERLAAHRTAAPTSTVRCTWPCKRIWELCAVDSLTREGCTRIGPEVYDCAAVDDIEQRGHTFFSLLPAP